MSDKVNELVEWVANILVKEFGINYADYRRTLAKQILSHPDLTLKNGRSISVGTSFGRSTDYIDEWWITDDKGDRLYPDKWDGGQLKMYPVIPLAEALKEKEAGPSGRGE